MGQNLQPAVEPGSMKMHGTFVRKCCGSLWAESPILRNLASCALPEIKCDEDTWNQLEIVLQGGPFPTDYRDLFKLLTVTVELQLKKWTRRTLKELFSTPDYWECQVPADTPDEIVLLCFRQPLNRLFRTEAVHRRQVDEILSLPDGPRLRASLTEELNSTIEKFMKLDLERVPCDFKLRCAPMLIMKRKGEFKTAFCNCDQRSCVPFELFGKFFDLSRVDIDAFHLKYASYLLYKSGEKVYFRNIKCEAKAAPYLDRCKLFISKYDKVLAVTEDKSECHIRIWNENEAENGGSFADIHSTTDAIANVDIGSSEVFLILKEDGSLLVAERGNTNLVITLLGEEYSSAWFHDGVLYGFFLDEDEGEDHRIHRFKRVSAGQWKKEREYSNRRSLEEFAKGRRITTIGGELFRVSENGFEMYSASGWPTMILSSEEYVASSELYLHP